MLADLHSTRRGVSRHVLALLAVIGLAITPLVACSSSGDDTATTTPPTTVATPRFAAGSTAHSITIDGTTRTYRTYVPKSLDRAKKAPLVVMLHGGFGSAKQAEATYEWDQFADDAGFIVVYPDGTGQGPRGNFARSWNAGTCCGIAMKSKVDDVLFLAQLVAAVQVNNAIDPRRQFVAGMSNGAMMAQRMACETRVFAAMASVAGAQMVPCDTAAPTSTMFVHGSEDTHVPLDGSAGTGRGKVPAHLAFADTADAWVKRNDCGNALTRDNAELALTSWICANGIGVETIIVDGAGHQWPGAAKLTAGEREELDVDQTSQRFFTTGAIWSFFAAHPAPR